MLDRRILLGTFGATLLQSACTSVNPALYTLAVVPGPVRRGGPRLIELRSVSLPRYLERSQIVRSSENYRLDVLGNDWWGEPLDAMLSRVLVQEVSQRLPDTTVFTENGPVSATPDATVQVSVQKLDLDQSGAVVLAVQVGVRRRQDVARNVRFSARPESPDTIGLVAAMSAAVGQMADAITVILAG
jgi:uncharacterized protein